MKALIRPATEPDAAQLAGVQVRTWQAAYAGLLPAEQLGSLSVERFQRMWTNRLADAQTTETVMVADLGGEIAGFLRCGPSLDKDAPPDRGQIYAIYVSQAHWRTKIGAQLNDVALESLRTNGFKTAALWVLRTNARACNFYSAVGWAPDGAEQTEEIFGMRADEIRYARSLVTP